MESIVLGIIGFSALFGLNEGQYSSLEVSQLSYKENPDSLEVYNNNEFSDFKNYVHQNLELRNLINPL